MKGSHFALMLFVLTPIAAAETVFGVLLINCFVDPKLAADGFGAIILSVIGIIGLTVLTHWIRYGEDMFSNPFLMVVDIPFAVIRLPLQLISVILGIISFFNDNLEVNPKKFPEMDSDGFFGFLFIHFLQSEPPSSYSGMVYSDLGEASDDAREYKWQAFRHHLKLWVITLLHSGLYIPLILWVISDEGIKTVGIFFIPIFIIIPVVYFLSCVKAAELRAFNTHDEYYDRTSTRYRYYEYSEEQDQYLKTGDYTIGPGWRSIISIPFLLYLITGIVWFIPQTIALIISLVTPPNAPILPVRHKDVDTTDLGFVERILFTLFGFIFNN